MDPNFPYGACLINGASGSCSDDQMSKACAPDDLIVSNGKCFAWLKGGNAQALELGRKYCSVNYRDGRCAGWLTSSSDDVVGDVARSINGSICKSIDDVRTNAFCRSEQAVMFGGFDSAASDYCSKVDDPYFCSCDPAWTFGKLPGGAIASAFRPCLYEKCKTYGYHYDGVRQVQKNCPQNLEVCNMGGNVENATDSMINQQCNFSGGTTGGLPTTQYADGSGAPTGFAAISPSTKVLLLVLAVVLVIIMVAIPEDTSKDVAKEKLEAIRDAQRNKKTGGWFSASVI